MVEEVWRGGCVVEVVWRSACVVEAGAVGYVLQCGGSWDN